MVSSERQSCLCKHQGPGLQLVLVDCRAPLVSVIQPIKDSTFADALTDEQGEVTVDSDGEEWIVSPK
jgi:hypothetical protein